MKPATILLTALLAGLSVGAAAQNDPAVDGATTGAGSADAMQQTQTFTELDANNDGVLDQDEIEQANLTGDFSDVDTNGDDEVDRNEYYQYQREQR